ncbi:hypothetical protein TI39_contig372g00005 [Zymoseptoria brevis]|uniref:Uncharacterized protein n=1 Tax=Zymoseptoria brevis TaxID=1047168 RepID=A0A0F4GP01_9PEZI|nr:hypothetical protein TI39_contig372g00005 [Zymoseptoria brevis]
MIPPAVKRARQCEILAHKLYGQCQTPQSSDSVLKSSLRRLRNTLGEIDEALDGSSRPRHELKTLDEGLVKCKDILQALNHALNQKKSVAPSVDLEQVSRFKSDLEYTCQDLILIFDELVGFDEAQFEREELKALPDVGILDSTTLPPAIPHATVKTAPPHPGEPVKYGQPLDLGAKATKHVGRSVECQQHTTSGKVRDDLAAAQTPTKLSKSSAKTINDDSPVAADADKALSPQHRDLMVAELQQRIVLRRQLAVLSKSDEDCVTSDLADADRIETYAVSGAQLGDNEADEPRQAGSTVKVDQKSANDQQIRSKACSLSVPLERPPRPASRPIRKPPPPARRPPPPPAKRRTPPPPPQPKPTTKIAPIKTYMIANVAEQPSPSDSDSSEDLYSSSPPETIRLLAQEPSSTTLTDRGSLESISEVPLTHATKAQRHRSSDLVLRVEFGGPLDLNLDLDLDLESGGTLTANESLASSRKVNSPQGVALPITASQICKAPAAVCTPRFPIKTPPVKHRKPLKICAPRPPLPAGEPSAIPPLTTASSRSHIPSRFYAAACIDTAPEHSSSTDCPAIRARKIKEFFIPSPRATPSTRPTVRRATCIDQVTEVSASNNTALHGYYGPNTTSTTYHHDLEAERIHHIVYFWNHRLWDLAENYLEAWLEVLLGKSVQNLRARRVQHLIAVCASLRGEWDLAEIRFVACLRRPILDLKQLDDGDCAAAYWLGDLYALQNRRVEAAVSYGIAKKSSLARSRGLVFGCTVAAEQTAVLTGLPDDDARLLLSSGKSPQPAVNVNECVSVLHASVMSSEVARRCFEDARRRCTHGSRAASFEQDRTRSDHINDAHHVGRIFAKPNRNVLQLTQTSFEPSSPWPLPYDPLFVMANVQHGRLFDTVKNLLSFYRNVETEPKLPRQLRIRRVDSPASPDLLELIETVRECLKELEMEHSETITTQAAGFHVRYTLITHRIATTHYFSLGLFKHTLRSGYGVEVLADNEMCSARLVSMELEGSKGVRDGEARMVRKIVMGSLDVALKARNRLAREGVISQGLSIQRCEA